MPNPPIRTARQETSAPNQVTVLIEVPPSQRPPEFRHCDTAVITRKRRTVLHECFVHDLEDSIEWRAQVGVIPYHVAFKVIPIPAQPNVDDNDPSTARWHLTWVIEESASTEWRWTNNANPRNPIAYT